MQFRRFAFSYEYLQLVEIFTFSHECLQLVEIVTFSHEYLQLIEIFTFSHEYSTYNLLRYSHFRMNTVLKTCWDIRIFAWVQYLQLVEIFAFSHEYLQLVYIFAFLYKYFNSLHLHILQKCAMQDCPCPVTKVHVRRALDVNVNGNFLEYSQKFP